MDTITISKKEYRELVEKRLRYEYLQNIMRGDLFSPPTKDIKKIMREFKETGRYTHAFLESLERGLRRSPYFKK